MTTVHPPEAGQVKTTEANASTGSTGIGDATRGTGLPPPTDPGVQPTPTTRGILTTAGAARPAAGAAGDASSSRAVRCASRSAAIYEV
jgi:hypothetical protein